MECSPQTTSQRKKRKKVVLQILMKMISSEMKAPPLSRRLLLRPSSRQARSRSPKELFSSTISFLAKLLNKSDSTLFAASGSSATTTTNSEWAPNTWTPSTGKKKWTKFYPSSLWTIASSSTTKTSKLQRDCRYSGNTTLDGKTRTKFTPKTIDLSISTSKKLPCPRRNELILNKLIII